MSVLIGLVQKLGKLQVNLTLKHLYMLKYMDNLYFYLSNSYDRIT
jgi:hypothetical protein